MFLTMVEMVSSSKQTPLLPTRRPLHPPLLKWPGGKRDILAHLLPLFPASFGRYFEPFVGGGAVFFALSPARAILADTNADLVNCYVQVRDRPDELIELLSSMPNAEANYYAVRSSNPLDPLARAARLVYLMTLSFNGIHRVNLKGAFNVPYGHKAHLPPCDPARVRTASKVLADAELAVADFEDTVESAAAGDLVYFDPPYTVAHSNNGFVKYNAKIFSWDDQRRLAETAIALSERGCHVVVSNADHDSVRVLYAGHFATHLIRRPSRISASAAHRRPVTECVFHNLDRAAC